jgi:outer membrane murein-binding lipoprotein Lpp
MRTNCGARRCFQVIAITTVLTFSPCAARCQEPSDPPSNEKGYDLHSLAAAVNQLQSQVQTLNSQVSELHRLQQETSREAEQLRAELEQAEEQLAAKTAGAGLVDESHAQQPQASPPVSAGMELLQGPPAADSSLLSRISKLEDDQGLTNDKLTEQSQTKVESGSKYRVRLSGIILLNTDVTRGSVDNLDFPQIAVPAANPTATGSFSGSLRQSQIGVEAFGPDVAGARTSANVKFDFAGGFPDTPNGAAFGIVRLRTGTIRLDWTATSIVAGQDSLFFAPLTPTTLSSLAIPALSYTGNLWSWTPQVRIEHRISLSESAGLLVQAGILDGLTGEIPQQGQGYRNPSAGEQSGQPAYAMRIAYRQRMFGRDLIVGLGGYYGRQNLGFGRNIDGWAEVTDVVLPVGSFFDVSGEFYRGRAVGGIGGGIGQSLLLSGPINNPSTTIYGLDSTGGWVQLKFKPKAKLEVNFAYGQDNPFASELRSSPASANYYGPLLSKNLSPFVNFIYRVRSDVLFSVEYRRLQTYTLDKNLDIANQLAVSLGYTF